MVLKVYASGKAEIYGKNDKFICSGMIGAKSGQKGFNPLLNAVVDEFGVDTKRENKIIYFSLDQKV